MLGSIEYEATLLYSTKSVSCDVCLDSSPIQRTWREFSWELPKVFFRLHPDENITSHLIRDFLHQVRLQMDGQMTVLWDRASVYTANRIERFFESYDRFDEIRIPTACPELNPCEGVWDWSKLTDMGNVTPQTFDDLISRTRSSLTKLQHRSHVHRWCHHQAEIDLLN